jgi:hypothetical protein
MDMILIKIWRPFWRSAVNSTPRLDRRKRRSRISFSNLAIDCVSAGCAMPSRTAAPLMLCYSDEIAQFSKIHIIVVYQKTGNYPDSSF